MKTAIRYGAFPHTGWPFYLGVRVQEISRNAFWLLISVGLNFNIDLNANVPEDSLDINREVPNTVDIL